VSGKREADDGRFLLPARQGGRVKEREREREREREGGGRERERERGGERSGWVVDQDERGWRKETTEHRARKSPTDRRGDKGGEVLLKQCSVYGAVRCCAQGGENGVDGFRVRLAVT